jgi:hypothetical protein
MEMLTDGDEEDWSRKLLVHFVGEQGLDAGGLRREFITLFCSQTSLLNSNTFSCSAKSLQNREYVTLGKLVAYGLIFGHPGLRKLHPIIVKYILTETSPSMSSDILTADIHSEVVKPVIEAVSIGIQNSSNSVFLTCMFYKYNM